MANTTKAEKATKAPKAKKPKEPKRQSEEDLFIEYDGIVLGSLKFEGKGKYANKQTVKRVCKDDQGKGDGHTFRVATSDLHQKDACDKCMRVRRSERAKAKRAEKRAEKEVKEAEVKKAA